MKRSFALLEFGAQHGIAISNSLIQHAMLWKIMMMELSVDDIAGAIQKHHFARTSSDKELLLQVETIQARAKDVLQKLGKN